MDYHIYLHDKTKNDNKPTMPKTTGGVNTTPTSSVDLSSPTSLSSDSSMGSVIGTVGKVAAIAYATYKIADRAVSTITPFLTRETGDYRFSIQYQNFKTTLGNFTNPISFGLSYLENLQNARILAKRNQQERLLLGDTTYNFGNRKI